jgi:hypothetical protein
VSLVTYFVVAYEFAVNVLNSLWTNLELCLPYFRVNILLLGI